jgi:hypothetical protein
MSHQTVAEHACGLVRSAEIRPDPFPHIVVDGIFPEQYYEELLSHLPAVSSLIFGEEAEHLRSELEPKEFRSVRGIVQCRITGARMGAHVDKATSLFTYLFYFAPDDSLRPFGTIFYKAQDRASLLERYRANRGIRAWFPEAAELDLRPQPPLEFRRNRLVSYVNLPSSLHGAATDAAAPRYSMQNFCDLPLRVTLPLYKDWKDPISPTGLYRGDA